MLRSFILSLLVLMTVSVSAQERQFPYQAQVTVEEAYVRSGGAEKFYPTTSLKRGAMVTVLRHDPGGWFMIAPPKGSFSWIPAKFVSPGASGIAEVVDSDAVVFVGSSFGDETSVWQRRMQLGEKVTILGQKMVDTHAGPKDMLKIAPPAREFRWVPGAAVVPTDQRVREANDRNPYKIPAAIAERAPVVQSLRPPTTPGQVAPHEQPRYVQSEGLARLKSVREEQRALQKLDQDFRFMILSDPAQWDLDKLERSYLDLQQKSTHKPIAGQIDLRYPAIYRYRQRKAQLDEFNRLTSQTEKRDAELMAAQFGLPATALQNTPPLASIVPQFAANPTGPMAQSSPGMLPVPDMAFAGSNAVSSNAPNTSPVQETGGSVFVAESSKYIGAGFLQRAASGKKNEFVLTNQTGKVLARLTPDSSVNLEKFVGQSVGLQGKRWFDPEVKTDRIEVSKLEAVRIR